MSRERPRRRTPFFRPGPDAAADEEIRHHIAECADRLVEEGWDPDEARREAERRFGDTGRWRREMVTIDGTTKTGRRGMLDTGWTMGGIGQDLRLGMRSALKRPASTAVLVLTLGLGIGAGTAIFTVVDALLLRPLPYRDADRMVSVYHDQGEGFSIPFMPSEQALTWSGAADFLEDVALYDRITVARTDGTPETLNVMVAAPDLDDLLGVRPHSGRLFTPDDAAPGLRVVLLTWKYWQRTGADPDAVGGTIDLDGEPAEVVGILPRDFKFPVVSMSDLWAPLATDGTALGRSTEQTEIVGRLAPGTTREAAQERADALAAALSEEHPGEKWGTQLSPVGDARADPRTRRALNLLAGAVGLMLLVSLLNAANLLVVRARGRIRELAVRRALGAGRGRVTRQIVAEAAFPAALSGALAVGLAWLALVGIRGMLPRDVLIYTVFDPRLGPRVLAFAFAVAAGAGLFVGLIPALHALRRGNGHVLASGDRVGDGPGGTRLRNGLVVVELALSVILLAGAGLLVNSFTRLARVDPGFEPEGLAYATMSLAEARYPGPGERRLFLERLERSLEAMPGVVGASVSMGVPPDGGGIMFGSAMRAEGGEPLPGEQTVGFALADGDYLDVLGIRLLTGRFLTEQDRGERVAVVDRDLAADLFGSPEAAPGRRFRMDDDDGDWTTVVGVMDDLKLYGTSDRYGPYVMIRPRSAAGDSPWVTVSVRGAAASGALAPLLRAAVRDLDPVQPIQQLRTGEQAMRDAVAEERFLVTLMTILSATALILAAIGTYGVLAAVVAERRRELGIRMALGAGRASIRRMVVGRGMALAGVGVVIGLAGAVAVTRLGRSLLFGVEPGDPATLAAVTAVTLTASLLAALLPTVRATRVDPAEVLRSD